MQEGFTRWPWAGVCRDSLSHDGWGWGRDAGGRQLGLGPRKLTSPANACASSNLLPMSKFTPTPAEVALINHIFAQVDTQKIGVITGDAAVKVFSGSKLSPTVLAEIWNVADEDNNGVLTRKGVGIAVRLLGHAQRGEKVSDALVSKREHLPRHGLRMTAHAYFTP